MYNEYDSLSSGAADDFLIGFLATYLFIILGIVLLNVFVKWKLFKKAGEKGWYSLIPFYSTWVSFRIAYGKPQTGKFFLLLVPFVNIVIALMLSYNFAKTYVKKDSILPILYVLFPFIVGLVLAMDKKYQYTSPLSISAEDEF